MMLEFCGKSCCMAMVQLHCTVKVNIWSQLPLSAISLQAQGFFSFCVLVGRGVMMWRNSKINQCCRLTKSIPGFLIHCIQLHRGALHRYWSRIYGQVGEKLFPGISHRDLNCCLGLRSNQSRSGPVLTRISVFWLEINHPNLLKWLRNLSSFLKKLQLIIAFW